MKKRAPKSEAQRVAEFTQEFLGSPKHSPLPWCVANGNEIHDQETQFDAGGARIGNTPNLIATVCPHTTAVHRFTTGATTEANAELIVRAVNCHKELVSALSAAAGQLQDATRDFAAIVNGLESPCCARIDTLAKLAAVNCERAESLARAALAKASDLATP